jgi:hypothetical protein
MILYTDRYFQLNEMLEEKVRPYIQDIDNEVLSKPIVLRSQNQEQKVFSRLSFSLTIYLFWLLSLAEHRKKNKSENLGK